MPDSNNTVDAARKMLEERRSELHSEIADIEKAISALGGKVRDRATSVGRKAVGRKRGRPAGQRTGRTRRSRKGGTRSEQAAKLISDSPGLSASEIATKLGIKPNYMYRVLSELEGEKKIRKDGRKYYPSKS